MILSYHLLTHRHADECYSICYLHNMGAWCENDNSVHQKLGI